MLLKKLLYIFLCVSLQSVKQTSCEEGISLSFVIDDTRSMWNDIDQVNKEAKSIMNMVLTKKSSEIKDMVIVTVNDPDVILRTKTKSPDTFLQHLNNIRVHNIDNPDCEEMSLTGIEKALLASRPDSYIYVFTDASAKDYYKLNKIKALCQKKQSQVVFVLTGDCGNPSSLMFTVYYDVAKACSGQVFRVQKNQVHSVLKTIEILLEGKNSIFKWENVPRTLTYIPVAFKLDDKAEFALISTSGKNVKLRITNINNIWGSEPPHEVTMWNNNGKVVKLVNPKPGTYYAWVKGDSIVSVVVYGRTDFTFEYGFSNLEPKSMSDTSKQPIAGFKQHASIIVTDPDNSIDIKTLQVLDIKNKDNVIAELPLTKTGDNVYITDSFISPNYTFKIAVKGVIKATREPITRNSKNIDPQILDPIPETIPIVNIKEGNRIDISYGSKVTLTCDVTAHPTPKIEWYTSSGVLLASESSVIEDPKFVSYLKLENIKNNETYVCKASNVLGIGQDKSIRIDILSIFTNNNIPKETGTSVKLGEDVKIPCNITSYLPIQIKWFKFGKELSRHSKKHSISSDGFELTLKSMNIDMQGTYTCEASLSSDPNIKEAHNTEVKIPGLVPPVITNKETVYYGAEGDLDMKIPCNVTGFPKPIIVWKKDGKDLSMDSKFSVNGTTLYVYNPSQLDSNMYTCIATNALGIDTKTFAVQVIDPIPKSVPKVNIREGMTMVVHYGSKLILTCDVTAHPTPKIEWYTSSGILLASENSVIKDPNFVSYLKLENVKTNETYFCKASNEIGIGQDKSIRINIFSIFTDNNIPKEKGTSVKLGENVKIPCNITSYLPIQIKWFKSGKELSRHSEKHSISPDGFELTLKSMNIDMQGTYTCEFSLSSEPNIKEAHDTEVKIPGLVPAVITNKETVFYGAEGDLVIKIPCNNTGFPEPVIVWKKEGKNLSMDSKFSVKGTTLYVHNPTQSDSNMYTCIATNALGIDTKTFAVQVIDPIPKSVPKVNIREGMTMVVHYGCKLILTCDVTAHPAPKIEWYTSSGVWLASENSVIKDPKFVSYLNLENIKNNETYVCKASNEIGIGQDKSIRINILSIFTKNNIPKETDTNVKLGEDVKVPCNITSYLPIQIKWFKSGTELSRHSEKHSISSDGFELILKSMNIDMQGTYTCEASLSSEPNIKEAHNTEVKIPGLVPPVITNKETVYYGAEGDLVMKIPCNVTGFPKPIIVWKKDGKDLSMDSKFSLKGTTLYVHNPNQSDSNKYTCIATNALDTDTKTFSVQVIDPIPKSLPIVNIQEGMKLDVNYGYKVSLTCNVTAHPTPKIEWYTSSGGILASESSVIKDPIYVSYLKLENITHNETYVCKALNDIGTGEDKAIQVNVRPVFTNNSVPKEINVLYIAGYNVEIGNDVKIPCNVTSYLPIQIKWFKAGKELSDSSEEYFISPDRFELTLKSMKIAMQETYTCEASLISDPTVKVKHDAEVKIPGLAVPEIQPLKRNIHLMKKEKLEINCTTIQGYPRPLIKWSKKFANRYVPLSDVENVEVLTAHVGSFKYAGQYKCTATNEMGSDFALFEVTMSSPPEITITDTKITITDTKRNIPYNSSAEFNCNVEAYPTPTIVWKGGNGSVVQSKVSQISKYEFVSHMELHNIRKNGVYICDAINEVGSKTNYVNLTVSSPFQVKDHIDGNVGIYYEGADTLTCDIKSEIPMKIRWLKKNKDVLSLSHKYSISDDGTQLAVKSMDLDMAGLYTCEASLISDPSEKVVFSADINVVGLVGPEVISSTTLLNDKNFTAICRIKGIPTPVISWKFQPKGSKDFHNIQGSEEELNIPELRLKHSGVYKCIAKNILGETQRDFMLVVKEPPAINNEETTYYGVEEDLVIKIPCNVTGFPDPTITWKRGDKTLDIDSKYAINGTTLYIHNPVQSDTNEYTCEATNMLGTATKKFTVEIVDNFEGDDKFNGNTYYDVLAEQDKPKSITCNMSSSDTVRWYKDGSLTKQTGSSFTIERVSYEDEGNYTCRVNTDEGPKSETYIVHVGYPPTFDDGTRLLTIKWQDNAQKLDCSANAEPSAEFKWIHNGKVIQSGVDLHEHTITDWGEYTCYVSNVHGYIQKNFTVISVGCFINKHISTRDQPVVTDQDTPTWLYSISDSDISLKENEEVKLSCPSMRYTKSTNGFKKFPTTTTIIAKCITEDKFNVFGKTYRYPDLQCISKVKPSIEETGERCSGQNTEIIKVGFTVNGFLEAYKVCYDRKLNVPLFANAPTPISAVGNGADPSDFEWSSTTELPNLKSESWNSNGSCKCCYTKGQLMNVNDVPFGPAQAATFTKEINLVPIWNPSCDANRLTWDGFVKQIRQTSLMFGKWSTWTGASEYTRTDDGLVPRYLWKVMKYDYDTSVMVFVNVKAPVDSDLRCSSACGPTLSVEADRFLYCCSLREFTDKFGVSIDTFETTL